MATHYFTDGEYRSPDYRWLNKRTKVIIFSRLCYGLMPIKDIPDPKHKKNIQNGEDMDVIRLRKFFTDTGVPESDIQIHSHDTCTMPFVKATLQKEADDTSNVDFDCFFFIFLAFPDDENIAFANGSMAIEELTKPFKGVESMALKPKVFILQADDLNIIETPQAPPLLVGIQKKVIPQEADFLIIHSTIPGCLSWFNLGKKESDRKGCSQLIEAFVTVLTENASKTNDQSEDVLTLTTAMLNKADSMVKASTFQDSIKDRCEVPLVTTTLTKRFYYPPNTTEIKKQ